jgi:Phage integrase family
MGLLKANPLRRVSWRSSQSACPADPRSLPGPAQVQAILAEVTRIRPELTAFFGCLYYAALRPAEAIALRAGDCDLPPAGWGQLMPTRSLPRTARAWTTNGASHEPRGLKHRPQGVIRTVPIPPELVRLLHHHLQAHGCASDGRLFPGTRGGPLSESRYGRTWHQATATAIPDWPAGPLLRPYDLRHAALSLWLASGAPPAEIAARAGHSVHILLTTYSHCLPGYSQIASQHIDQALDASTSPHLAHKTRHHAVRSRPPCVRATAGPGETQRDLTQPTKPIAMPVTCANTGPPGQADRPGC